MNDENELKKEVPVDLKNHISYAEGSVVSKTLVNKKTGTLTLFAFDEGQELSEHTAPFDAVVQILDGQAELTIGGQKTKIQTGELIIMPANIPHAVHAPQKFKMLLTMIHT
ncbi:MAG: cupin domain-containing protein [Nitrospina sp.]|jgi:quercetin dioxygenase-like cupin family protein|nr:cupin domain-containing protein [Nitrospina sp.]MBT3414069.1 cupin domain-containing protein [Nitrospina sp.]MBT3857335.1 cupin domain-containing protein [Nitrospina sp.]MBT4105861.1 cupin domain-containing protein [Nitrospina sp.]MBT4388951.1 cupin domain-containing protein [Nitrospina sp.]